MSDVFDEIRRACARVAEGAAHVRIDGRALAALAARIAADPPAAPSLDPAHHALSDPEHTLAYVVTLDAINFGSGWFPVLRKREGLSGYFTIATRLKERFERKGPWSAADLSGLDTEACCRVFGQDPAGEGRELMALFAQALRDLGVLVDARFRGRFEALVAEAKGSAAALVGILSEMPFYRDVSRHAGFEVPFYKRAQLTAADLHAAFEGRGPGRFDDLERLTIFADNLVPHVLRREGVLVYTPMLGARIDRGDPIEAGSPEEVEIRACAVHAVERCVETLRESGAAETTASAPITAHRLDHWLWNRGQRPEMKAHPRHRARTVYY